MKIPFSPPYIDNAVIDEVMDSLNSGWITTGPKVKELESAVARLSGLDSVACVNSWTSGALLALKWLGIKPGDEVIVPAYTYSATALVAIHLGAKPIMVDVLDDFTIDPAAVRAAITDRTKAVIAVDFAGWPCNYSSLRNTINDPGIRGIYRATGETQKKLGRILIISDAAHSIGSTYDQAPAAKQSDITIFSFHAVKNITSAEGGAICLNLPDPFNNAVEHKWFKLNSLNGQTKDAFTKSQAGGWKYDIVSPGLKINMPDICAAIALAQIRIYEPFLLPERKRVFEHYDKAFSNYSWAQKPMQHDETRNSCYHLYPLRVRNITEQQRDDMIDYISSKEVSVNVHFIPMPMLTLFKEMGYKIENFPVAYDLYSREISLPIYPQLTSEQLDFINETVVEAYQEVCEKYLTI